MSGKDAGSEAALDVWATNAFQAALRPLAPRFEEASGQALTIRYRSSNMIMTHAVQGERGDAVIATRPALDELAAQGVVDRASIRELASIALGIGVRAGADKPDVSSAGALREALLTARKVVYSSTGASGMYFAKLLERLGVAAEVRAKSIVYTGGLVGDVIARGEADIGAQMVSEILAVPGVELAGELPAEFRHPTVFGAGVFSQSARRAAAQALIGFLAAPRARVVLAAAGMQPVSASE